MRRISSSQMNEKRKKGVYFYCDEKWGPGHVCKKPKVYLLQVDEFLRRIKCMMLSAMINAWKKYRFLFMYFLDRVSYNSMKLFGKIENFSVEILVDSNNTHNFLDLKVV